MRVARINTPTRIKRELLTPPLPAIFTNSFMSNPRDPDCKNGAAETIRKTRPSAITLPLFSFHIIALSRTLFPNISRNTESDNFWSCFSLSIFTINNLFLHPMPWLFSQDFLQKCFCDQFQCLRYMFDVGLLFWPVLLE